MEDRRQNTLLVFLTLALILAIAAAPSRVSRLIRNGRFTFVSSGRPASRPAPLPVVGTFAKFKALMKESGLADGRITGMARGSSWGMLGAESMKMAAPAAAQDFAYDGYSTTNVQVRGVDEADIVKTDGEYIYQVNNQNVTITKAAPPEAMKVVASIKADRGAAAFNPQELYVDDRYLVVVGLAMRTRKLPPALRTPSVPGEPGNYGLRAEPELRADQMPPDMSVGVTKVIVYDIGDKSAPRKIREAALEGDYISSRKIGSALYLTANRYVDAYMINQFEGDPGTLRPAYMDSAVGDEFKDIDYRAIRYFPDLVEPNYLMVAGLNLDDPEKEMEVSTYLGAGQNVYASTQNLYVAVTQFETVEPQSSDTSESADVLTADKLWPPTTGTRIYKFAFNRGEVDYLAQGEVPGTILNQYSMDESGGHFRLATNSGDMASSRPDASKNNLYVLDADMKTVGKLEGLAPGERIYSTRFMGERAYVVTFKQVDPLFVIDLKDPRAPRVLGSLKIPGYSDYLHPYDEDHIIGFGKEAVEAAADPAAGLSEPIAYYQGMKIALFDVSDVARPVEKFKTTIGDRGTDSELLHNPKALLFDKERNLMAFPVTVLEVKDNRSPGGQDSALEYGEFAFQGAYVYNISLDKGLNLKGRIAHQSPNDTGPGGMVPYGDGDKVVDRALYIGETLYTVSKARIQANALADLKEIGSVDIPN